ncbi:MAG: oxidoreductase [Tenericutes bacterium HGW-Tenericutes-1]|nr:MAG: oxidoreductase [Tenericutes bacterium HGW-Tenericutes-1]
MKIAWIGTGVMGNPMARHLQSAGYNVSAYNRTFEKAKELEPLIKACHTIEECVNEADVIFSIVGYPKDVKEVYDEVFKHAKKSAILVDMTTSSPTLAKDLFIKAKSLGLHMIDAPVTGGDVGAINATLSIMAGGNHDVYQTILPLLQLMGKTITYMGEAGNGQHAKLANQVVIAGNIAAIAESLLYAKSKDLNLDSMLNVITGGSASSWQAQINGRKMINHDYAPGFFIKHFLKDLKLVMEEKQGLELEVVERVVRIFETLNEKGYSENGTQAIIEYYLQKMA